MREMKVWLLSIGIMIFFFSSVYADQVLPVSAQSPALINVGKALLWGLKLDNWQELIAKRIKYTVKKGAYILKVKADPKDRIEVEVGDIKQDKFCPQVKIKRWDDEVNLAVRLINDEKTPTVSIVGNKIKWRGQKVEAHFYDIPTSQEFPDGAYEFEVILKEKPATNKIEFTIQHKGLVFYYQPELTQTEKDAGDFRPDNIVGSYAVYCAEKKTNWTGGKLYRTGKFGHIFRPKIIDSAGTEVWGALNIDTDKGLLTVIIPQDFLDNAVYPVRHAAGLTFGHLTAGGSSSPANSNTYGVQYSTDSGAGGGSATSQSWYFTSFTGGTNLKVALYSDSSGAPSTLRASGTAFIPEGTTTVTVNFSTPYTLAASTAYWMVARAQDAFNVSSVYYDATTGVNSARGTTAYASFPPSPYSGTDATYTVRWFDVYTTYTAGTAGSGQFLMIE